MHSFGGGSVEAAQTRTHPGLGREYELPMPYSLLHQPYFLDFKAAEGNYFFVTWCCLRAMKLAEGFGGPMNPALGACTRASLYNPCSYPI